MSAGLTHADYELVDEKITKTQYSDYQLNTTKRNDNYTIDYTNITKENISEYNWNYDFSNLTLEERQSVIGSNLASNSTVSMEQNNGEYPYQVDMDFEVFDGNSYNNESIELSSGTYQNTKYENGELQLKDGETFGYYKSDWYNYSQKRSVDSYYIEGNYSKVEYKLNSTGSYQEANLNASDDSIQNIPTGTVSDSFKYKITLNSSTNIQTDNYIYQVEDNTTLQKINKNTGTIADDTAFLITGIVEDMVVGKNSVFVVDDSYLYSFNKNDLTQNWEKSYDSDLGFDSVAEYGNYVYAVNEAGDKLYKSYKSNGTQITNQTGYFSESTRMLEANDKGVFSASNSTKYIYKFNDFDLSLANTYYLNPINDIDLKDNYVYVASDRTVYKINMVTSSEVWNFGTSTILGDDLLVEINHVENTLNNYPVTVSTAKSDIIQISDDGQMYTSTQKGAPWFYREENFIYYGKTDDGRYKLNITNNTREWYKSDLGAHTFTDGYYVYEDFPQNVSEFNIAWKNSIELRIKAYDENSNLYYENDTLIEEYNTYSDTLNNKISYISINADRWDSGTNLDYDFTQYYSESSINSVDMFFSFNESSNSTFTYSKSVTNLTTESFTFTDTTDLNNSYTYLEDNNRSVDINMTLKITYYTYRSTGSEQYIEMMTDVSFYAILFLIICTGFTAYYSSTAGMPILVFTIGLFPLSYVGFVSWVVTGITSVFFIGYYIMYSRKRQNEV